MNCREGMLAAIGVILLAAGAQLIRMSHGPARDVVLDDACRSPVRVLEPPTGRAVGSAVVFHGLSANRRLMLTLGQSLAAAGLRVYLVDSPGHGDSTEPFSLGRTEQCAAAVLESLARRGEIALDRTVVVGHSMGAAVAAHLADRLPVAATIALSPAPINLPRRMPANLLIVYAQFDPQRVKDAAAKLLHAAGGERSGPEDFRQRRAVRLEFAPWTSHVGVVFNPRVERAAGAWARRALEEKSAEGASAREYPFVGGALGVVGLLLLFPLAASIATAMWRAGATESPPPRIRTGRLLCLWVIGSLFSVGALNFWVPLRALRMYNGDYLGAFNLLAGAVLLAMLWREKKAALRFDFRATAAACVFGLAATLAIGAWLNWQLTDGWMNLARWERFVPLVLASLPYFVAEEWALGPPAAGRRGRRFARFLALRIILWLALIFALFAFGSQQILMLLLGVFLLAISLVQRWGADVIRQRTGSSAAGALVGAILAGWFIAAIFPLT